MLEKKEMENCNNSTNSSVAQHSANGAGSNTSDDTLYLCNFQSLAHHDIYALTTFQDQKLNVGRLGG